MQFTTTKIVSLGTVAGSLTTIILFWDTITGIVVTKSDIEQLANDMRLQNIEIKISLNEVRMRQYEEMGNLEPQQQRRYEALIKSNERLEAERVKIIGH